MADGRKAADSAVEDPVTVKVDPRNGASGERTSRDHPEVRAAHVGIRGVVLGAVIAALAGVGGGYVGAVQAAKSAQQLYLAERGDAVTDWRREVYVGYLRVVGEAYAAEHADEAAVADHQARTMLVSSQGVRDTVPALSEAALNGNEDEFKRLREVFIDRARAELTY